MKFDSVLFFNVKMTIKRLIALQLAHLFHPIIVLLITLPPPVSAQITENLKFRHYSIEHGLSQVSANCILQDNKGYIWIGTQDGLNRFDGYTFTIFRHNPQDSTSLSNNNVNGIFQDAQNRIWVGTSGGLNLFEPKTQAFTHFQHDPNNPASLSHNYVNGIFQDRQNRIWVGTDGGLNLFNPKTQAFTHFQHDPNNPASLSHNYVNGIFQDRQNRIWVGTSGGLNLFDPKTQAFTHFQHDLNNPVSLSSNNVRSIFQDRQNRIWVGTIRGGLNLFDPKTQAFTHFQHDPNNPSSLSNNSVSSIFQDRKNRIWVGTSGGLNLIDLQTQAFTHFQHDPNNPASLSDNIVSSIFQDRQNRIWVGTYRGGLNLFDPQTWAFTHFQHDPNNPASLSDKNVMSIFQDQQNRIWVGTSGGGLDLFDPQTQLFTHFRHDPNNPASLSHNLILTIFQDRQNRIWVGTFRGGLNLFDPITQGFTHFQHDPNNPTSLSDNRVWSIFQDRQNRIWVGTTGGLNLFDPQTQAFTHFQHDPNNPTSLSNNSILSIFQDRQNRIWIGTWGGGLDLFDLQTQIFTHFQHDPNNPASLSDNRVWSIFQDFQNRIWVGTNGGLNLLDPKTAIFKTWREKDGLSNDMVHDILEDGEGNLWLSTDKGINKFNPKTEEFTWYDKQDDLQSHEFSRGAFHENKDSEMYFGVENGFTMFHPDSIKDNTHIPPVVITDFLLFNKSVKIGDTTVLKQAPDYIKEITLAYDHYIFAFEFSVLNYRQPEKNQFAYKLEGFNEDWIYTDYKDRKATYTNVPYGTYTFRVKASNDDGYWNEEGASIKIIISPPWWLTVWAYLFYVTGGVFFIWAVVILWNSKQLKKQKRHLEEKVKSRTKEVVQQKDEIHAQAEELKARSEELKASNEQLEKSYAQLQELDEYKEVTTAMIVHDFKNSLNTIISFSDGTPNARRLKSIKNASRHMLNLALNMLDVQKFEQAEVSLALADIAIPKVINGALEQVSFLIEQKSLKLTHKLEDNLYSNCDLELVTRVITNLLTNAIKYTPANGSIHIQAEVHHEFVKISISDTGQGIPKDKLQTIFGKFAQVEGKQSGEVRSTGLGLTFCKMVVEAHGGEIGVESEEGKGSTFWFTIQKANTPQDIKEEKVEIILDSSTETVLELNEKDKAILQPYMKQLQQCEVYDYSDVREIISSIQANGNPTITVWLEEMQKALQNVNEEIYEKLINPL